MAVLTFQCQAGTEVSLFFKDNTDSYSQTGMNTTLVRLSKLVRERRRREELKIEKNAE
jgi:hypothetical protein